MSHTTHLNNVELPPAVDENPPLSVEHAELFLALDRLLSIGSYYTPEHAQYQKVAQEAHTAISRNLRGAAVLEIECTSEGFWVHEEFIASGQKETRRVYDLLNNLAVGLLEIDADATADDLHVAVASLKLHLVTYAGKKNFEEIAIESMPETIRTTSQSLYVRTKDRSAGPGGTRPRHASDDPFAIPDANLVPTPEGQKLEREFLGIISAIMRSGDPTQLKNLDGDESARNDVLSQWVTDSAVRSIKEIMEALKKTNSDPMVLEHLIGHAQLALEMTGEPEMVELVFDRLRKETGVKSDKPKPLLSNRPKPKNPKRRAVKYTMTPEQMNEAISKLADAVELPSDLLSPAGADTLGICAQVLCSAPTESMVQGISATVFRVLGRKKLIDLDLQVAASSLNAILQTGSRDLADRAIPMFFSPLRRFHPEHVGPVWLNLWKSLVETDHKILAWPHLVNELLLGVDWEDPGQKLALFESLSRVNVGNGSEMLERLEELQALKEGRLAPEIFHAPAPLLYPVHLVLLASTVSREHGPKLHQRLAHQRAQLLANLLVSIMGHFKPSNKLIYQAILDQGVAEKIQPKLQDLGSRLLKTTLTGLDPELRDEPWVSEAVTWLGRLDLKRARRLLEVILNEKKFFFLPVWSRECRQAARAALEAPIQNEPTEELDDEREASGDQIQ